MAYVYLNGEYLSDENPLISSNDRGFLLGDGLFETLKYKNHKIALFEEHIARLKNSAKVFLIPFLYTDKTLFDICMEVVKRNHLEDGEAAIRITLSRGPSERGINLPESMKPTLCVMASAYKTMEKPVTLYISSIIRQSKSLLTNHKTINFLDGVMARAQAKEKGFDDSLMLNEKNYIACTSTANIFFMEQGALITPDIASGILPGIMRQYVIDICKEASIPIEEREVDYQFVLQSEEAFITNSLIGLQPVLKIDEHEFGSGATTMLEYLCGIIAKN